MEKSSSAAALPSNEKHAADIDIKPAYDDSEENTGDIMTDVKGPPPAYESLSPQNTPSSAANLTPSDSLDPDEPSSVPLKPEDRSAAGQLLAWIPSAPRSPANKTPLVQPVAIPQVEVAPRGEVVPFARCYSDALTSYGVSVKEFMAFLDGLELAQAPNSALQGLKLFGVGVSKTPLPFVPLLGMPFKAIGSAGSGHTSSRAKHYIERARKEYFEPRGLRLSIVNDSDLGPRLQVPSHAYRLAPLTKATFTNSLCERRMEGIAPYVAPLRYDVPEQDNQVKGVQKMARKHLESRLRSDARSLGKMRERQWQDIMYADAQYGLWDQRYADMMSRVRRSQQDLMQLQSRGESDKSSTALREAMDALQQDQIDLQRIASERHISLQNLPGRAQGVEEEMREESWSRSLRWIVIENFN